LLAQNLALTVYPQPIFEALQAARQRRHREEFWRR
jgi:hypothetical protein